MKKNPLAEALREYGITEKEFRRKMSGIAKYRIIETHLTENEFEFGIVSDTHLCSTEERLNELHTFYAILEKMGIQTVVHAGDLLQGMHMYPGWEMETKVFGADNQASYAVANYPMISGITTYFCSGNHDASFFKESGTDVCLQVAAQRNDLIYMGQFQADIKIGGILVRLIHPSGGNPYAISYRGQKIAEQIPSGQKPHILVIGH